MKVFLGLFFSILAALFWGIAIVMSKLILKEIDSNYLFIIQVSSSAIMAWIVLVLNRKKIKFIRNMKVYLLGILEPFLAYILSLHGLAYVNAGISSILFSSESIMIIILSTVILKNQIKKIYTLYSIIFISLMGILLLSWNDIIIGGNQKLFGYFLVLAGVFFAAIYVTLSSKAVEEVSPITLLTGQLTVATVLSLLFLMPFIKFKLINNHILIMAIFSGLCQYYFAFLLYLNSLKYLKVHVAGMMLYLIPVFTILGSYYFLGEGLTQLQILGCFVVMCSVVVANFILEEGNSLTH